MDKELVEDIFQQYIVAVENYVGCLGDSEDSSYPDIEYYFGQMDAFSSCLRCFSCSISLTNIPFGIIVVAGLFYEKFQRIYRITFDLSGKVTTEKIDNPDEL